MAFESGAGGFQSQFQSQFASPSPAPGTGGGENKRFSAPQTLRAVTFRQILRDNSEEDQVKVDNVELSAITVVGRIVSVEEKTSSTVFVLDDGTGRFEVRQWSNDSDEAKPEFRVGSYLRVYGSVKDYEKTKGKAINAYSVKVIHDYNEVSYHFLQCIFQHLQLTKGAPPSAPSGASPAPAINMGSTAARTVATPATTSSAGLNDDVISVYNAPEHASQANGVSLDEVRAVLQKRGLSYTQQQILGAVTFLTDEGLLYSTTDESHHKSVMVA